MANEVKLNDCLVMLRDTEDVNVKAKQMDFLEAANLQGIDYAYQKYCHEQIFTDEYQL